VRTAVAAVVVTLGCAPTYGDAYLNSIAAGERAYGAGRYDEAARAYDEAAERALRVKDRDEARFLEARTFQRAGRWGDASASYRKLIAVSPRGPRAARAEFELADLEIDHGNAEHGWQLLAEAARHNPGHGLARHAITRLAQHAAEQGGEPAALAWLQAATPRFAGTELEQAVAYEIALCLERQEKLPEARDAFLATARAHPYPFGGLTDDAYWRAADAEVHLGHPREAIEILRELLSAHESPSQTVGSYERPRFSQAQHRIAELYRDGMKDPARARVEFHKVYTNHPTSILRDDALWSEARLAHDAGDHASACDLMALLAREFSESRYARCTRELCPSAPAPKDAHPCPDYVKEELAK